jgi:hypothetical protein
VSAGSTTIWILAGSLVALLALALVYALRWRRVTKPELKAAPSPLEPRAASRFVDFEAIAACHPTSWRVEDQPEPWRTAMAAVGERLARACVVEVMFVHGTMTGHDPLAVGSVVKRALPLFHRRVERVIQRVAKAGSDRILGDLGNYAPEYVRLFETALRSEVRCSSFVWSSANHHVARLRAAAQLALRLAKVEIPAPRSNRQRPRVLLVGHSHAGQVFALLTQLLAGGSGAELLVEAARACGDKQEELLAALDRVRRVELDFVTMGTAPRYAWGAVPGYRATHLVNHRAGRLARRPLRALLDSAQSDYMRRLGAAGSDFVALTVAERRINSRLDAALGTGSDLRTWLRSLRSASALMPTGTTLFVRYDQVSAGAAPKLMDAYFGHGVYTRKGAMLFTAQVIADQFYPDAPQVPALAKAPFTARLRHRLDGLRRVLR